MKNIVECAFEIKNNENPIKKYLNNCGLLKQTKICSKCGHSLSRINKNLGITHKFQCNYCNSYQSEFSNTLFVGMKISLQKFFIILHYFISNQTPKTALEYFKISYKDAGVSLNTIKTYYRKFLFLMAKHVKSEMDQILFDNEVEIDETLVYKKKTRDSFGRPRKIKIWIFGIKDHNSKKFVLYTLNQRTRAILLGKIIKHISLNCIIYSDSFSVYVNNRSIPKKNHLERFGYTHFFVNHQIQFVSNILSTIHINKVERMWRSLKKLIKDFKPILFVEETVLKFFFNEIYSYEDKMKVLLKI